MRLKPLNPQKQADNCTNAWLSRCYSYILAWYWCKPLWCQCSSFSDPRATGQERVLDYYSKSLSPAEHNYCVTRKELLAYAKAAKHFRPYLHGKIFQLQKAPSCQTALIDIFAVGASTSGLRIGTATWLNRKSTSVVETSEKDPAQNLLPTDDGISSNWC